MRYVLLIYNDELEWANLSDERRSAIVREYFALTDELRSQGTYLAGAPLQPTSTATTVRVRNGEQVVTDGPFVETKEQLGGYFLVEAESDEEARAVAARIPAAHYGAIEVRPLVPIAAAANAAASTV